MDIKYTGQRMTSMSNDKESKYLKISHQSSFTYVRIVIL